MTAAAAPRPGRASVLVLNTGSSSVKYRLGGPFDEAARGIVAGIGEPGSPIADHAQALAAVLDRLGDRVSQAVAVGHRVVHGGSRFRQPALIDDAVMAAIQSLVPLAPLHNPASLAGIRAARTALPGIAQVAVFDTAFHSTLPPAAATYALDRAVSARYDIRRYGFHGISVRDAASRCAALLGRPIGELNQIVLHLGNGASATAVAGGRSVFTSMGMTPLPGLVMGTRTGDIDPAVVFHLARVAGMSLDEIEDLFEHHGGLAGLCGENDLRLVHQRADAGDRVAAEAIEVYSHRIRCYVGALHAVLGRLDAVVFTGGVGEHSAPVRAASLSGLSGWGIEVDPGLNAAPAGPARLISPSGARVPVCVLPADEERAIAAETLALLWPE